MREEAWKARVCEAVGSASTGTWEDEEICWEGRWRNKAQQEQGEEENPTGVLRTEKRGSGSTPLVFLHPPDEQSIAEFEMYCGDRGKKENWKSFKQYL